MENSPLYRLPAELRNQIWEYALLSDTEILISDARHKPWRSPTLLRTCSQIRTEASGIYYTGNTFVVKGCDIDCCLFAALDFRCYEHVEGPLASWLSALPASSRTLVRRIRLDGFLYREECAEVRVKECKGYLRGRGVSVDGAEVWIVPHSASYRWA